MDEFADVDVLGLVYVNVNIIPYNTISYQLAPTVSQTSWRAEALRDFIFYIAYRCFVLDLGQNRPEEKSECSKKTRKRKGGRRERRPRLRR